MSGTVYPGAIDGDAQLHRLDDILQSSLTDQITSSSSSLPVTSTANFPPVGVVAIYDPTNILNTIEYVAYTSKSPTSFMGLTRGLNTRFPAKGHSRDETVSQEYVAEQHNDQNSAIVAIETALGLNPQSTYADVSTRLDAITTTLAGFGSFVQTTATTNITMTGNSFVYVEGASQLDLTLPATAAKGVRINIVGTKTGNGFRVKQNASQYIVASGAGTSIGTERTTAGTGGSMTAADRVSTLELVCTVANVEWTVVVSKGSNFALV